MPKIIRIIVEWVCYFLSAPVRRNARKAALRFCLRKIVQRNYRHVFSAINYFLQLSGKTRSRQRMDLTRGQNGNARLHKCKPGGRKPLTDLPDPRSGRLSRLHWVNPKTVRCQVRIKSDTFLDRFSLRSAPTKVQVNTINFYRFHSSASVKYSHAK